VPISRFQSDVLGVIAQTRDPESCIVRGSPINRAGPRISEDADIFHDREEAVARAAARDAELLAAAGHAVTWVRREPALHAAQIARGADTTELEWVVDSDYRYFPTVSDPEFGYVLHVVDLAVNKLMAAASRREPRDVVDLVRLHQLHLPISAIVWAAVAVAPDFTPEGLLAEIRRNARYSAEHFRTVRSDTAIDGEIVMRTLRTALDEAESFVSRMPTEAVGTIYLKDGTPVMPDPAALGSYVVHKPRRRGHWPTASDISSAMLDRLQRPIP